VVQFKVLSGKLAGHECVARRFPFQIGRSPASGLRLDDPGVWDQHLIVDLGGGRDFQFQAQGGANALVNGQVLEQGLLLNGDSIQIGAVELRFGFSATRQKNLLGRELLVWFGLAAVSFGQIALIYWLLR
jgi:hypothetical protein